MAAGFCQAVLHALRVESPGLHRWLLLALPLFLKALSERLRPAAMRVLVEGDALHLIVGHVGEPGWEELKQGVPLFHMFLMDDGGQRRMAEPGLVKRLITGIATWLLQVRNVWFPGDRSHRGMNKGERRTKGTSKGE